MLLWASAFLGLAVVAHWLGFSSVAVMAAIIAKVLFALLIILYASLVVAWVGILRGAS